jgi:cytochrome c-type biogenesis protein
VGIEQTIADGQLLVASLIALAAGLVSFLSPCVLPLIPGYLAYVSGIADGGRAAVDTATAKRTERRRMVLGAVLFVLGFTLVFLLLNIIVGSVGLWLWEWQDLIIRVMGVLVIVLGLVFMGLFSKFQGTTRLRVKPRVGLAGAPLLGVVFAIGWAPCLGPTLGVVLSLALQTGSTGRASVLAIAYCIGLGIPFILAAFGFSWMTQTMTFFKRHIRIVNLVGGGLLILIGLLMVTGVWNRMMISLQAVMTNFGTIL